MAAPSTPYGITDPATGAKIGKAVVKPDGSVQVALSATSPTGVGPGPSSYPDFATAQSTVGGMWFLYGQ